MSASDYIRVKKLLGLSNRLRAAQGRPKKISSDKLAEVTLHGKRENDRGNDATMEHKGVRVVMTPEKQPTKKTDESLIPKKTNERIVGKNWYAPRK